MCFKVLLVFLFDTIDDCPKYVKFLSSYSYLIELAFNPNLNLLPILL